MRIITAAAFLAYAVIVLLHGDAPRALDFVVVTLTVMQLVDWVGRKNNMEQDETSVLPPYVGEEDED